MSLNINKNFGAISNGALLSLNSHQTAMGKAVTRVSTGMRVNSPVDDASAYMTSKKIQADATGYETLANGMQTSSAKLNAANSLASSVLDVLNAMKAKAIEYQAACAAKDSSAQTTINDEFGKLTTVLNSALNTKYNDESLANNSTAAYSSIYSGTSISGLTDDNMKAGKISGSWAISSGLTTGTDIGAANGQILSTATDSIVQTLTDAIKGVVTQQGQIGAALEAMEYSSSFLSNIANAQETAFYSITEADMAKEMTTYVRNNVLAQASQAMIAQANQSMASVLNLLQ